MGKSDQANLWNEDLISALDDVVRACGSYKKVAGEMWPGVKTSYNKLKNKLNREHHEQFSPDEVVHLLKMGREVGCHAAMYFICDDVGYNRPNPSAPKSQKTVILEKIARKSHEIAELQREVDRLSEGQLRAVE